eukprot:766494-Hanusia_phi.AAC.2
MPMGAEVGGHLDVEEEGSRVWHPTTSEGDGTRKSVREKICELLRELETQYQREQEFKLQLKQGAAPVW